MQCYNLTKNKHSNKKVKKLGESIVRCQRFHSYFHHMICTKQILLWFKKTKMQVWLFPHSKSIINVQSATPSCDWPWWHLGYKSLPWTYVFSPERCVFTSQVLVLKKKTSIKLCFRHRGIQPKIAVILQVTGRGIEDLDQQSYKDDVLVFWKISPGKTEESSFSGKTHILSR